MTDQTIPEPVASFIEAVNRHDEDALFGTFAANPVVDDWGSIYDGREAIKTWSDREFLGARGLLTVEEVSTAPGEVTVIGDWRSSFANGRSRFVFRVAGDAIERMTIREG